MKSAQSTRPWLEEALAKRKAGDAVGAEACLRAALRQKPADPTALFLLGVSRLEADDLDGAEPAFAAVVAVAPRHAPSWLNLGLIRTRKADHAGAAAALMSLLAVQPTHAEAWLALSHNRRAVGDADAAAACAERSVVAAPGDPRAWQALGLALVARGDDANAAIGFDRAVALDATFVAAHAQLGALHERANRPLLAEQAWQNVLRLAPDDVAAHVGLSTLYCRAERYDLGRAHAEAALRQEPGHLGAHQNLAGLLARQGEREAALRHREIAFRKRSVVTIAAARPRLEILMLASAEAANAPDRCLITADRYTRHLWFMDYARSDQFQSLPRCDVVFNAIADPDCFAARSQTLAEFAAQHQGRLLNPPDRVARTARSNAAELYRGLEAVDAPRSVRLPAEDLWASGARATLERLRLAPPFLARPVGSHGGEGLVLLQAPEALDALWRAGGGGCDIYATEFRNFRSTDGLYRKYRMFFVDRRPYPYHLAIADHWLVHYDKSGTSSHEDRLAEERKFLADPVAALGARAYAAVAAIGRRLDLDFAGIDFALDAAGDVVLFEANATMLAHDEDPNGALAHKNAPVRTIIEAFWLMLEDGARKLAA